MSSKYLYRCKSCGYTKLSDDKQEVKEARNAHKRKTFTREDGTKFSMKCILVPTGRGTVARPIIADIIAEEIGKINSLVNYFGGGK